MWCMVYQKFEISDFRNKKKQKKFTGSVRENKKMKRNRVFIFATMEEALLGFVRQGRYRNLHQTREIINTKAK
jgi:hypothetical protein